MFEPCIKFWKVILNFDWIMAIEIIILIIILI
jgi:hypothetical protein